MEKMHRIVYGGKNGKMHEIVYNTIMNELCEVCGLSVKLTKAVLPIEWYFDSAESEEQLEHDIIVIYEEIRLPKNVYSEWDKFFV